jgi:predicted transcriptional regulator
MHPPPKPRPRQRRYSVRRQARLDAETYAKLEALTRTFHRKRAAILRYVIRWGLVQTQRWTVDPSIPNRPHLVHMPVEPNLLQQVQDAADARGASVAASWRAGDIAVRSHDSGHYGRRFMLRLDDETLRKLETLTQTFQRSAAEVIRQLIAQARPETFPPSWRIAAEERRGHHARRPRGQR